MSSVARTSWDAFLLPRGLGDNPWANVRYRGMARALDTWAFRFLCLNNVLGLYAIYSKFPPSRTVAQALPAVFYVFAGLLQRWLSVTWPDWYYRHRHHILALQRLVRVPVIMLVPYTFRRWIGQSTVQQAVDGYNAARLPISDHLGALGFLMALSGAMHTLTHVAVVPLPLRPQLCFQATYLAILVVFNLAPAAVTLDMAPFKPQLQRTCNALNSVLVLLASAHSGIYLHLEELDGICRDSISLQMVLFVQLYFCFALPLYYAYRLEMECNLHMRHVPAYARRRMQRQPAGQHTAALGGTVSMAAGDLGMLLGMVMACWLAAIAALPYAPRVMWPLRTTPPRAA